MGKNLRCEDVWVRVCECICLCVYVWGGSGWGVLQCVKETEIGGKCVKGPYPSVLHIFAEAAVGAWLTDEWGVRG